MKLNPFAVAVMLLVPSLAFSQSIEEKQKRASAETQMSDFAKTMNKYCKTALPETGMIDWSTWPVAEDEKGGGNASVSSQCKYVIYGTESLCRDEAIAQETVAKDVKKFLCKGDGKDEITFEMKGDTLIVHTAFGLRDTDKKAQKWLSKNLQ